MTKTFDTMAALSMLADGYEFKGDDTDDFLECTLLMSSSGSFIDCLSKSGDDRAIPMRDDWYITNQKTKQPQTVTFEFSIEESRESCGLDALVDYLETDIEPGEYTVRIEKA
jgi:hypothetical protein